MKFPYGLSDFYRVMKEGYYYVDRTAYIRAVEEAGSVLLFLRPRRFGKSLWLSTLENYYDVAKGEEFEALFVRLAIGRAPTPLHNKYLIMRWNFSVVDPSGDYEEIRASLFNHINGCIEGFVASYQTLLGHKVTLHEDDALRSLQSVLVAVRRSPYRLYLLIDEYDNFANEVMVASTERYEALVRGEGVLKTVFKAVKDGVGGLGIERVFITGVSPVVMSDATSAFNVAKNIYTKRRFSGLCGFTEGEVAEAVEAVVRGCGHSEEKVAEAMEMVRSFYNGYRFHPEGEQVYNPTLVLYFLEQYQEECRYPRQMLDSNLAMDRNRLAYAAALPHGGQLILDALSGGEAVMVNELSDRFGVREMVEVGEDRGRIASLLYYLGVLTLEGEAATGELVLRIPNLVVRRLYAEQMRHLLLPRLGMHEAGQRAARTLYVEGDIGPLCEFIEARMYPVLSNRDYRWANELTVKTAFLSLLFNDILYVIDSEPEIGRGYADLVMIIRPDMRRFRVLDVLIEFKYVKLEEVGLSGEAVREESREVLRGLEAVERKLEEARRQLKRYRRVLEGKYGEVLRLHTYAVVSLGFERLVWEEV